MLLMLDVAKLLKNSVGCAFTAGFLLKIKVVHGAGNHSIFVIDISINHSCVHSYADVFAQQVVRTELVMQSHPFYSFSHTEIHLLLDIQDEGAYSDAVS